MEVRFHDLAPLAVASLAHPAECQGQPPADVFQQWIAAQVIGAVLILVAASDLVDPLADQRRQGMLAAPD